MFSCFVLAGVLEVLEMGAESNEIRLDGKA